MRQEPVQRKLMSPAVVGNHDDLEIGRELG